MKKIFCLFCLLSLTFSCKRTQLTSSINKRSNKIYVNPIVKNQNTKFSSEKNISSGYLNLECVNIIKNNSVTSKELLKKEELFADVSNTKPNLIKHRIPQRLITINSILKSNDSTLIEKEEILNFSKKTRKFSILSLFSSSSIISLQIIDDLLINELKNRKLRWKIGDFINVLSWIIGITCFILSVIGLHFLIKAIKKIKKSGDRLKHQNKTVKKNLKIAFLTTFLHFIAPIIIGIWLLIWIACCFSIPF